MNVYDISPEDGHWLAGLTDGEGFFVLMTSRRRLERYPDRLFHAVQWTYGISLRADDEATLYKAQKILKVGSIRPRTHKEAVMRGPNGKAYLANPRKSLRVFNRADIERVIAVFTSFPLRSKKARDFDLWRKAWCFYHDCLAAQPRKIFRKGLILSPSIARRRPLQTDKPKRFYSIPDEAWRELDRISQAIKVGRRYVDPLGL